MKQPGSDKKGSSCPRCNAPVPAGAAFCEACGARVASPPACSLCGTLLEPGSRFCPSCGTMIGNSKDHLSKKGEPEKKPAAGKSPKSARAKKSLPAPAMEPENAQNPLMVGAGPGEDGLPEDEDDQAPESLLKKVPAPASTVTIPPQGKHRFVLPAFDTRKAVVVAGLILLLLGVATLVLSGLFTITPAASSSSSGMAAPAPAPGTPAPSAVETTSPLALVGTLAPVTPAGTVSLVPGPTQLPPEIFRISFQAERDPRSYLVTVQYMGGKGQYGVVEVVTRLTRSDGQVLTDSFKPVQIGSGVELQGTEKTDRLEVITRTSTGEEYTVIDKLFEYKIRN